jgi:putative tryptophan/tyrosine transport system substrate-binding protein
MRRRAFVGAGVFVALAPGRSALSWAQGVRRPVLIGWIGTGSSVRAAEFKRKFAEGMRALGYQTGRDYALEDRNAGGVVNRLPALAAELVGRRPDVIVAATTLAAVAAKHATAELPIVGPALSDPLDLELVQSYARPGANVTGILSTTEELAGKQLSLALELVGGSARVGILVNRRGGSAMKRRGAEAAAAALGTEISVAEVDAPDGIAAAFQALSQAGVRVVSVIGDAVFLNASTQIATSGLAANLPTVFIFREHVEAGGMMSYGVNLGENFQRAAVFVDKILRGEKPADLPVELPTKFELVINLKTANALSLAIPATLLARADEVIE